MAARTAAGRTGVRTGGFCPYCGRGRRLLAGLGCVLAVAGGRLFARLGGVRVRRRDWRDAHGRSFAWRSGSDTGNSFLPCPQHGLRPPYRGPAPVRIIPERYSRRAPGGRCGPLPQGAGGATDGVRDGGQMRVSAAPQGGEPRLRVGQPHQHGRHQADGEARPAAAAAAVGRTGVEDGQQQGNAGDDREGEAGPLVAFLFIGVTSVGGNRRAQPTECAMSTISKRAGMRKTTPDPRFFDPVTSSTERRFNMISRD